MKELFIGETIYEINDSLATNIVKTEGIRAYILAIESDLTSENQQKLIEILNAIELKVDHNAQIIKLKPNQSYPMSTLGSQLDKPLIISFGLSSLNLNLQSLSADYFVHRFENLNLVMADSLTTLIADKVLKGKLWNCIKHFKTV